MKSCYEKFFRRPHSGRAAVPGRLLFRRALKARPTDLSYFEGGPQAREQLCGKVFCEGGGPTGWKPMLAGPVDPCPLPQPRNPGAQASRPCVTGKNLVLPGHSPHVGAQLIAPTKGSMHRTPTGGWERGQGGGWGSHLPLHQVRFEMKPTNYLTTFCSSYFLPKTENCKPKTVLALPPEINISG
jgi:hypothetical protein